MKKTTKKPTKTKPATATKPSRLDQVLIIDGLSPELERALRLKIKQSL